MPGEKQHVNRHLRKPQGLQETEKETDKEIKVPPNEVTV